MARKAKQSRRKKMNPTFFVFCEGKMEAAYVDLLRRSFRVPVAKVEHLKRKLLPKYQIEMICLSLESM